MHATVIRPSRLIFQFRVSSAGVGLALNIKPSSRKLQYENWRLRATTASNGVSWKYDTVHSVIRPSSPTARKSKTPNGQLLGPKKRKKKHRLGFMLGAGTPLVGQDSGLYNGLRLCVNPRETTRPRVTQTVRQTTHNAW